MSDFMPGEIVDVTIKGARVSEVNGNVLRVSYPAGGTDTFIAVHIGQGWPDHFVERVAPKEWPPLLGDVWEDRNGRPWFVKDFAEDEEDAELLRFTSLSGWIYGDNLDFDGVLRAQGPMRLAYRPAGGER